MAPGKVLDYSFMGIGHVEEVVGLDPANVEELVKDDSRGTKPVMAVRLSYNHLADLGPAFSSTLSGLTGNGLVSLRWLDLSFNSIESVEPLLDLKELAVLYLHSNKIEKVSEVRSLAALSKLHKLTLHGNPVEEKKQYRSMVLHHLPTLHELDFSCVTHRDREKSHMWAEFNRKALRKGERDDDRTTPAY